MMQGVVKGSCDCCNLLIFGYILYVRAGSHGVPSLTHVNKSEHGGKVTTFELKKPLKYGLYTLKSDLDCLCRKKLDLCC